MRSRLTRNSTLVFAAMLMLISVLPVQAAVNSDQPSAKTLTINVKGTLGPILSGQDPLGVDGQGGKMTIKASEGLSPKKHTQNSATYVLPAGAVTIMFGSNQFKTTSNSTMTIKLSSTADLLILSATGPQGIEVTGTVSLKTGSWTSGVLKHPATFSPSPQKLKAAKSDSGPGSKVKYTVFGSSTVLGLTGSASCSEK